MNFGFGVAARIRGGHWLSRQWRQSLRRSARLGFAQIRR